MMKKMLIFFQNGVGVRTRRIKGFGDCKIFGFALLVISLMSLFTFTVHAEENPESVVEAYVQAMDEHDWYELSNLHCNDERVSLQHFFNDSTNAAEHVGVLNVENASLVELKEINLKDAADMLYKEYDASNTKVFVFGVDYDVYKDSKYFSSGINYNFITCVKEGSVWKISEMIPIAEPEKLITKGYEFTNNFSATVDVMRARNEGCFINYNGEVFAHIGEEDGISTYEVINQRTVPTSTTQVRLKKADGNIESIYFHDYCLGVLAGEVRGKTFDGQVRQAQAIAVKTFTWHYLIIPKNPTEGYDLNYLQQSYKPDKVSENTKVTEDYDAVKSVWMESYGGAIFAAYYKAGVNSDQSKYKNGGEFKQNGALWLYNNDVATTYKDLLKYYYDSSSASKDGAIRFFDDNKNEL